MIPKLDNWSVKCTQSNAKCKVQIITLCTLHFAFVAVHLTDQLSNFKIITDYLKVVDFIEEMGDLYQEWIKWKECQAAYKSSCIKGWITPDVARLQFAFDLSD